MNHSLLLAELRWLIATDTEEVSTVLYAQHTHTHGCLACTADTKFCRAEKW